MTGIILAIIFALLFAMPFAFVLFVIRVNYLFKEEQNILRVIESFRKAFQHISLNVEEFKELLNQSK